jgi:uncharacterized membrane protein YcaP (DUF421 family)
MNQGQQIHPFDWRRLLIGQAPAGFILEIAVRALVIYVVLLVAMRLMGKRTASQLTLTELAVVVTLGAAVGVPMQTPERGLLAGFVVLGVALIFQRAVNALGFRSGRITRMVEGDVSILIKDGVLDLRAMKVSGMAREQIFSALRTSGMQQLGQVRRLYLEASGQFSVLPTRSPRPGLSIVPTQDAEIRDLQERAHGQWACQACGYVARNGDDPGFPCEHCGQTRWTHARTEARIGLADG